MAATLSFQDENAGIKGISHFFKECYVYHFVGCGQMGPQFGEKKNLDSFRCTNSSLHAHFDLNAMLSSAIENTAIHL